MRYFIGLIVIMILAGCSSSSSDENLPSSPQTQESSNIPPAIPKI